MAIYYSSEDFYQTLMQLVIKSLKIGFTVNICLQDAPQEELEQLSDYLWNVGDLENGLIEEFPDKQLILITNTAYKKDIIIFGWKIDCDIPFEYNKIFGVNICNLKAEDATNDVAQEDQYYRYINDKWKEIERVEYMLCQSCD